MSSSRRPGPLNPPMGACRIPARTPGPLGFNDQGDPNVTALLGDTPGPLGVNDWAMADLAGLANAIFPGAIFRAEDGSLVTHDSDAVVAVERRPATSFRLSAAARSLLKLVEASHLKPYDDQTGKEISAWVEGATIGYGHLIKKGEWDAYKDGLSGIDADSLFGLDLAPFVSSVQTRITALITQNEFDALVIMAFNIGATGFADSAVVRLVNDPAAKTAYGDLEAAWKAWNKSQGKVMAGLVNRRQCEWDIYARGIYRRW